MKDIEVGFPVCIAVNENLYEAAWVLLFNIFCSEYEQNADWHGLALTKIKGELRKSLRESWMDDAIEKFGNKEAQRLTF